MELTREQITKIIEGCRGISNTEHLNKINNSKGKVSIPALTLSVVDSDKPLGPGNMAIFVNANTFRLLKGESIGWIKNQTIVIHESFLKRRNNIIEVIGMIIHETGHAFNVAAGISNTETNAYIFEIEVMLKLFETKSPLLFGCDSEVGSYFHSRLSQYQMAISSSAYLLGLINIIKKLFPPSSDTAVTAPIPDNVMIRPKL